MVALEVLLNGKRVCVAGAEDLCTLSAILSVSGALGPKTMKPQPRGPSNNRKSRPHLHIGGLTCRGQGVEDSHLSWVPDVSIKPGDTLSVRIAEVTPSDVDPPVEERDTDESMYDSTEREIFEIVRETYLALRDKYGAGDVNKTMERTGMDKVLPERAARASSSPRTHLSAAAHRQR
jgi:hypothetical protein